jgi:hypothetical protein
MEIFKARLNIDKRDSLGYIEILWYIFVPLLMRINTGVI